ncbi:hypothetical protein ASE37_23905 [Rhizobium sp. Root268]|nr:hypothetical protein ASC86_20405 [Rhizobium sp. Root1212]KRD30017.1 hypothetical protein ASE37_23905 [Rhizobium sp. Root268]
MTTADNFDLIAKEVRYAKMLFPKLDMVAFGELATWGLDSTKAETLPGPTETKYYELARELGIWLIPGSLYEKSGDLIHNAASVIDPDGRGVTLYRKMFPWMPFESKTTPGEDFVVFDIPGQGRIGLSICYDNSFPEVARGLAPRP